MNLNEFAREVHENAVAHGFYDPAPSDAETIALIHSEISEALEKWRNNQPMAWYECDGPVCIPHQDEWCAGIDDETGKPCHLRDPKPHGIAVELIDVMLRILDAATAWGLELQESYWSSSDPYRYADQFYLTPRSIVVGYALPELVCELHYLMDELYIMRRTRQDAQDIAIKMSIPIYLIYTWLHAQNLDPEALLREKHTYNKTRPYRHGGKRI